MATGFGTFSANAVLNAIGNNTSFAVATVYVQLHIGDPGAAGTANAAAETTRKTASFGAASAGSMSNDAIVGPWTSVAATETYSHVSLWDASPGGNFLGSGTVTGGAVTAGDDFQFPVGDLTLSTTVAS